MSYDTRNEMYELLEGITDHHESLMLEVIADAEDYAGDADLCEKLIKLHDAYQVVIDHLTKRLEQ